MQSVQLLANQPSGGSRLPGGVVLAVAGRWLWSWTRAGGLQRTWEARLRLADRVPWLMTIEPVTTEPVSTEPVTTVPVTTVPVTTEPVTTEPHN